LAGLFEHGLAAHRTVVRHRDVPGHEIAPGSLVLVAVVLTAVVGVAVAGGLLEDAATALGAPAGHGHHQWLGEGALRVAGAGQEATETSALDHHFPPADVADLVALLGGDLQAHPL